MTYKTHEQLGITAEERAALILTLDVLRQEQMIFDMSVPCFLPYSKEKDGAVPFCDTNYGAVPFCDTKCCIGGSMSLIMQSNGSLPQRVNKAMHDRADEYLEKHAFGSKSSLYNLFYDNTDDETKPTDGVRAVENFLNGNITSPWDFYERAREGSDDED